jgi:SAM-dependent methyltransferase
MSESWNQGYFTDVGYTHGYYREINPVFQRFCLLANGLATTEPAEWGEAAHAELGFGQGVSANIHAAANPGLFVGTDFNPAQAAHASALAWAGGSGARLHDDSFEQLLARTDLPAFDSISLHGIWTWVSRENHHHIVELARRHLKPGGVFYMSYNCFPGWAPAHPLRQLFALHDRYAPRPHGATERVNAALAFSEALLAAEPNYLKVAPQLPERLKAITAQNRQYLAHEYFNREWNCMYFTDVVDALAPAKLEFACSAVPLDTVDAVNLSAAGTAFLATLEHPVLREQARDYFVNQQFRKDLYLRGARRLSASQQRARLLETRLVLLQPADAVSLKVTGAAGEAALQEAVYAPLVAALAARQHAPKTLHELAQALPNMPWAQLQQAAVVLVGTGAVAPCQSEAAAKQVHKRCAALNRQLRERARLANEIETLASPVTGGGVAVNRFQQLFLSAMEQGRKQPAEWAQQVWQILVSQDQRLLKDGKTIESAEDNLAELTTQATSFAQKQLPILRALQVA